MSNATPSALIADPSNTVRLSLRAILQGCDIGRIDTASTIAEARRKLIDCKYDVVLCEYHFEGDESGQDLLEELREKKTLPLSTLFIMVTGEAAYARVAGVAEETPDDYMLKPVQAGELSERLEKAFARRQALMEIYEALNGKHYTKALKAAQQMMALKTPYLADIIKLAANIFYRLGRLDESAAMYKRILETRNPAWAKLGLARVALRQGDKATAETAMLDIINQYYRYLPVYNQLVELYLSEERFADALDITEQAIKITPNNLKRLQKAGQLAYSLGDATKAAEYLGRAVKVNGKAVDLDYRSIFHLALMQFDGGQAPDAASLVKQIAAKQKNDMLSEDGRRGEWYGDLALATESIARREPLAAIDLLRSLAGHWDAPDFNFEFALDYFTVIDRLYADDIAGTLVEWLQSLALRFNTGRQAEELLIQPLSRRARLVEVVGQAGVFVSEITNQAAKLLVDNDFRAAAEILIPEAQRTRNNRLLAAAANAAAKCFQSFHEPAFKQQAETCLAFMVPVDELLTQRLRALLAGPAPEAEAPEAEGDEAD
ncbi:response regulator [Chitinimonas arctica]|uniref:Response regulator n=1 Tax=Chitinimonas arctica TaxID=2594795 RepID=A0A516SH30_9NEIS|nr:response regulator [Chitinimonas arctica]QDQ27455.1 response regulator [Chitinimonas arctica]